MAQILILTTDLPYFPGKNGHDFFNLRHLAEQHEVAVVAPRYDFQPAEGIRNLQAAVDHTFLWPESSLPGPLFVSEPDHGALPRWMHWLPASFRRKIVFRRLGLTGQPPDSYHLLCILANCAPHLLHALRTRHWQAIVLIQSSIAAWLKFLPAVGAKVVYFHDVRSDYLGRTGQHPPALVTQVQQQEQLACDLAEGAGFVSELDRKRASRLLKLPPVQGVASIPVDTDYYHPAPAGWKRDPRPLILFTGHLGHPPNVDAVQYFLAEIWPLIRQAHPTAVFQVAGMHPSPELAAAVAGSPGAELHPNVPDIRPYFWNARAYVVPMRFGGGVRQKIFEAWSMRVPVVCTTMGAEGTEAQDGISCALRDTPAAFAAQVGKFLAEGAPESLIRAAELHVARKNSIPVAAGAFGRLSLAAIGRRRARPFRLLYDLRWMEIGRAGGVEQMSHELIHAISHLDRNNEYRFHVPRSTYHEWDLAAGFQHRAYFSDAAAARFETLDAVFTNRLAESVGLPPVLNTHLRTLRTWRKMDFDLVHSTAGYLHPDLAAFPHILSIHDLQHLSFPEFFPAGQWQEREALYRESANRAAHIITISEFTRQDVHRRYGIPLEKITTIWNIPSRNTWVPLPAGRDIELLRQLEITGPFLFFPAHCWPHKNHVRLLEAFELILPHVPPDLKLVLTGRPFPEDHPARALLSRPALRGRAVHLGYRSPLEMKALFHQCEALVFPSLFEGFGMPVAEAIIAGKPVACSRTTSLPEIAGDAAVTFDPENIHDIGGRLLEVLNDPERRAALSAAALRRRTLFSARRVAVQTISLYHRVHQALYQT